MLPYKILNGKCVQFKYTFNESLDPYYPIIEKYTILCFENCPGGMYFIGFNQPVILTKQLVKLSFNDPFNKTIQLTKN